MRRVSVGAALAFSACWSLMAAPQVAAAAKDATRAVHFAGRTVHAPASWPVYRLDQHPRMCVRLDRRAVYLGRPASNQRCPAGAIGRRRAILVEPPGVRAGTARGDGRRLWPGTARGSALPTAARAAPIPAAHRASASSAATFTGLGFDACSAPSSRAMSAWGSSPYRAVGVYIGGVNRACSQPNLTPSWVSAQTAASWHLIPTYVGLQAPTSSCSSCAKLSASQATAQGSAAALDAVEEASAVAIGSGSPIYFDMESYSRTSSASAATLAFLQAWTVKLHSLGYLSGVYSSSASGIADLAGQLGTGYTEPDHLWIANWNGSQSTSDPAVPAGAWMPHRRIHQYRGGHNETYGGVTINIDNDYVDAATVGSAALGDPVGYLDLAKSPARGQVRVRGWAFDPDAPTEPLAIRLYVGGKASDPDAVAYELGGVASRSRRDVAAEFPEAGPWHGFDLSLATVKSGRQRVCAYALDLGPGSDRLLGCKAAAIPVAIAISNLRANARRVWLRIACQWPVGTECPGQVLLRTRFRVPVGHYRGHGPHTRAVTRVLGRTAFRLSGKRAHGFHVPLSAGGRAVLRRRGELKTQVIVAIPGGRRIRVVAIGG